MNFSRYAEMRLSLESKLVKLHEEELLEANVIDLERKQLVDALLENHEKLCLMQRMKEKERQDVKRAIAELEADFRSRNGGHEHGRY